MKKFIRSVLLTSEEWLYPGKQFHGQEIVEIQAGEENGQMARVPIIILIMEDGTFWEITKSQVLGVQFRLD